MGTHRGTTHVPDPSAGVLGALSDGAGDVASQATIVREVSAKSKKIRKIRNVW